MVAIVRDVVNPKTPISAACAAVAISKNGERDVTARRRYVANQPAWPRFNAAPAPENRLSLQPDGSRVISDFDETHQCGFWETLKG